MRHHYIAREFALLHEFPVPPRVTLYLPGEKTDQQNIGGLARPQQEEFFTRLALMLKDRGCVVFVVRADGSGPTSMVDHLPLVAQCRVLFVFTTENWAEVAEMIRRHARRKVAVVLAVGRVGG